MKKHLIFCLICFSGFLNIALAKNQPETQYTLEWGADAEHTFTIRMIAEAEKGKYTRFRMPAWRPGRYILQNYAVAVSDFKAFDLNGNALAWEKTDKDTWQVQNAGKGKIQVQYRYYANTLDAGSSYVGKDLYYFNGINLFMYIPGRMDAECVLKIPALNTSELKIATALPPTQKRGIYRAKDYHQLVDCPVIISGKIHTLAFNEGNARFYLHFQGNYKASPENEAWLKQSAARLFQEQAAVFGGVYPFKEYHALYILTPFNQRHAVEHSNSSCYTLPENVTSSQDAMNYGILGITSHEFWHVWNVKKIRPAAMVPYQYEKEAYTRLHWFTEGVTSYMEELTLARAGLRTEAEFYAHLANTAAALDNAYAGSIISCSDASFDTWLTQTRTGNPFHRSSFYALGERAGFILDLYLRQNSCGRFGMDEVFRRLNVKYGETGLGVPENGIEQVCAEIIGRSCADFFKAYIHGTQALPYDSLLKPLGLKLEVFPDSIKSWEKLGIQAQREAAGTYFRLQVKPGSDAMHAGLGDDDLIVEIFHKPVSEADLSLLKNLRPGDSIPVKAVTGNNIRETSILFTGKDMPRLYKLMPDFNAEPEAVVFREDWLQSLVLDEKKF